MGNATCKINKDLTNQVVIVTGSNTGIGKECVKKFAKLNAQIVLACRSEERTAPALKEIQELYPEAKLEFIKLDLSDLESVKQFADTFKQKYNRLDILLNNAGVMTPQTLQKTKQNFELQLGTNHLGHFVLTNQLLPLIKQTEKSRIVNVSSLAHSGMGLCTQNINFDDLNYEKKYDRMAAYAQSKLANILFTRQLQKNLEAEGLDTKVVTLHPGVIDSDLARNEYDGANFLKVGVMKAFYAGFSKNVEQGAQTNLYCSLANLEDLVPGGYYKECSIAKASKHANDPKLQKKFWDLSNELVKDFLIQW